MFFGPRKVLTGMFRKLFLHSLQVLKTVMYVQKRRYPENYKCPETSTFRKLSNATKNVSTGARSQKLRRAEKHIKCFHGHIFL